MQDSRIQSQNFCQEYYVTKEYLLEEILLLKEVFWLLQKLSGRTMQEYWKIEHDKEMEKVADELERCSVPHSM